MKLEELKKDKKEQENSTILAHRVMCCFFRGCLTLDMPLIIFAYQKYEDLGGDGHITFPVVDILKLQCSLLPYLVIFEMYVHIYHYYLFIVM